MMIDNRLRLAMMAGTLMTLVILSTPAMAQRFCVYDPLGANGDFFAQAKDYQLVAKRWGVGLELKAYTDEAVAVEDFKAGQCDLINMTGMRARLFNPFTGTIDAVGAIESYAQIHSLLDLINSPKAEKYMVSGQYEVFGILPLGAGYPFVNDRSINTLAKAAGKKVAVLEWDKTQAILVQQFGAQPVASDITNFAGKFNNGSVDVIVAPAVLYKPFELYKGLGSKGGIIRRAVIQLTLQLVARRDKFPADFGRQSRDYSSRQIDHALGLVRNTENEIDPKHWLYIPRSELASYNKITREARVRLAKEGFYDKRMLAIMKRVRCKADPEDAECSGSEE